MKIYDWMKIIGFAAVVVATIIATVIIPRIDNRIIEIDRKITKFRDSRIITNFLTLDSRMRAIDKTLYLLGSNVAVFHDAHQSSIDGFKKLLLSKTAKLAEAIRRQNRQTANCSASIGYQQWFAARIYQKIENPIHYPPALKI